MSSKFKMIKHPLVYVQTLGYINGEYYMIFEDANLVSHVLTFSQAKQMEPR